MSKVTTEQLLKDPTFQAWAEGTEGERFNAWNAYLEEHPEEREHLLTVKAMVQGMPFHTQDVDSATVEEQWKRLSQELKHQKETPSFFRSRWRWSVAAAILLAITLTTLWYYNQQRIQLYHTDYGEISAPIALEHDQARVILNAHSTIRYQPHKHQVWLEEGEAWFEVVPGREHPFLVRIGEWSVSVTGTAFSVSAYAGKVQVVLQEGSVVLEHSGTKTELQPGQLADLNGQTPVLKQADLSQDLSWLDAKWVFGDGTTWAELAERIERHFGMEVVVRDPAILRRQISGDLMIHNKETLFRALEAYSSLDLQWTDDTLTVQD